MEKIKNKLSSENNLEVCWTEASNPLTARNYSNKTSLSCYTQEMKRESYDVDIIEVIEVVRILNNLAPLRMPVYNFNFNDWNTEFIILLKVSSEMVFISAHPSEGSVPWRILLTSFQFCDPFV